MLQAATDRQGETCRRSLEQTIGSSSSRLVTMLHAHNGARLCIVSGNCNRPANNDQSAPVLIISSCATRNSLCEHRLLMKLGLSERGAVQLGMASRPQANVEIL